MEFFKYNDLNIAYDIYGNCEDVLVLLNGIMMNQQSWTPFLENLCKTRKVIVLDMVDQGFSSKVDFEYSIDMQVDVIIGLIDHLNIKKFDLFGISYGAHVALNLACDYSSRVNKLLVFNCLPYTTELLRDIGNSWIKSAKSNDSEDFYYTTIPVIYSTSFYAKNYEWIKSRKSYLEEVFNKDFLQSMIRLIKSSESHDVRNKIKDIKCSTLVVGSKDDLLTPCRYTKMVASLIDKAIYFEMDNCGHASMYEKPNEFLTLIIGFLNRQEISII